MSAPSPPTCTAPECHWHQEVLMAIHEVFAVLQGTAQAHPDLDVPAELLAMRTAFEAALSTPIPEARRGSLTEAQAQATGRATISLLQIGAEWLRKIHAAADS